MLFFILHPHFFISFLNATTFYNPFYRFTSFRNVPNATISSTDSINLTNRFKATNIFDWFKLPSKSQSVQRPESMEIDELLGNETNTEQSSCFHINEGELTLALDQSLKMMEASDDDIKRLGWKLVQKADHFCLYKRRSRPKNEGPYEYFMRGEFADVSPRSWLLCQTSLPLRSMWDDTMKTMSVIHEANRSSFTAPITAGSDSSSSSTSVVIDSSSSASGIDNEDIIYYRTKWYVDMYC
jgi:hypothetical protein